MAADTKGWPPAARRLLEDLRFRHSLGQSWLLRRPRQRYALYVPEMTTGNPVVYLRTYNAQTLAFLQGQGMIEYGPETTLVPFQRVREDRDQEPTVCTITLTEEARP